VAGTGAPGERKMWRERGYKRVGRGKRKVSQKEVWEGGSLGWLALQTVSLAKEEEEEEEEAQAGARCGF